MGRAFREGRINNAKLKPRAHPLLAKMVNHDKTIAALAERAKFARSVGNYMMNQSLLLTMENDEWVWQNLRISKNLDASYRLMLHEQNCEPFEICMTLDFQTAVAAANELAIKCEQVVEIEPLAIKN
ncbi:MAG: hypothetical protein VX613_02260 [Candidatus Thermoplasmatota archaeon]|nr:hypothetical protein [Candidatus Thermoplasmatota archaeon]